VHAEAHQELDRDHVDRQCGQPGEAEVGETLQRQSAAPKGPQFVQDVVGDESELDGRDRGREQGESE